jgi:phage terminase small subunit
MTDRQRRFLEALLCGPRGVRSNATRAAEAAGYAWPGKQGPRLMTHPAIAEAIRIDLEEYRERLFERTRAEEDRFWREVEALKAARRGRRRTRGCM